MESRTLKERVKMVSPNPWAYPHVDGCVRLLVVVALLGVLLYPRPPPHRAFMQPIEVLDDAPDPCAAVSIKFLALCCPVRPRPKTSLPLDPHLLYNSSPCRSWAAAKLLSYSLLEAKFTTKICGAYGCAAPRGISHWVHPGPPRPCAAWTKPTLPLPAESAVQIMIMITKRSNPTQRASSTTRLRASTSLISMSI